MGELWHALPGQVQQVILDRIIGPGASTKDFTHWWQDPLSKALGQALRESIRHHGAITSNPDKIRSAVKRLYGVIRAMEKGQFDKKRADALAALCDAPP